MAVAKKSTRSKRVVEKKTGEKYASKAAMARHERSEPASMRKKEYGKSYKKGMK